MNTTLRTKEFRDIFKHSLRLNARSMSVKTLLSERNLKRINYSPYYQRNYVWDNSKQSFFIESVILGTEIPPLILFKSGFKIEVIDGRQRFETLKKFKENQIKLKNNGLKELKVLDKKSFNRLEGINQEIFLDSNIRVYEFEIINQPDLEIDVIDRVKKEIFRRYNTGITPLKRDELDNAKYDEDEFSELFKAHLRRNWNFLRVFNEVFFPKATVVQGENNEGVIAKNVDFIRRYRILKNFPISTYARGKRTEIIELLYDFAKNNAEDAKQEFEDFLTIIKTVIGIYEDLKDSEVLRNKLVYDCILWAMTIAHDDEEINVDYDPQIFRRHYLDNISAYREEGSHYYSSIIARFEDTAGFFKLLTGKTFQRFIRNDTFRSRIDKMKQTEFEAAQSIEELSTLRLNKPNPISTFVDEIRQDIRTSRYLLRPSYQRQEKINVVKASSIIESILLGISLPPIFIYKRTENNVKEVVDGQQRLLAIIGFLGETYLNEDGKPSYSKNNNFKLKGLKILTELEGNNYNALSEELKEKLLDFPIDLIIIEESINEKFDPIDLFIRLNYKPYPIKANSFEMWNSIVDVNVIKKVKEVTAKAVSEDWFYLREVQEGKPDRMLNEELILILSYVSFHNRLGKVDDIIGFFQRQDRITCRLKNKKAISEFLIETVENDEKTKRGLLDSIERTEHLIAQFARLFDDEPSKDKLNEFLNVKSSQSFRRSLQDFYLIWLVIDKVESGWFDKKDNLILEDIGKLLGLLKNTKNETVDDVYMKNFQKELNVISSKRVTMHIT